MARHRMCSSLSCVCYAFVRVCLFGPCGHLLGKGRPLGSRLWCITVSLSLSHWYPGPGVVLDRIDSSSLYVPLLTLTWLLRATSSNGVSLGPMTSRNPNPNKGTKSKMATIRLRA